MSKNTQMEFPAENGRLPLGYRFHPTEAELVVHYLKRKVLGKRQEPEIVVEVDIYQLHPEDLRGRPCMNNALNLYFFCARGKKYGCGDRTNRATQSGYWKATGHDKPVLYRQRTVGMVKHLVFHEGKLKEGKRTNWVMHEYRLEDSELATKGVPQDAFVLCKIFKKNSKGPRNGEQFGSPYNEEEWNSEEELENTAPMVPVADQDQVISVNESISAQVYPLHTLEQVYPGALPESISISDQAPARTSGGSNVASTSKVVVSNSDDAVDQGPVPTSNVSAIASTSEPPVQRDDVAIMLDGFYYEDIFDNLVDLDDYKFSLADLSEE